MTEFIRNISRRLTGGGGRRKQRSHAPLATGEDANNNNAVVYNGTSKTQGAVIYTGTVDVRKSSCCRILLLDGTDLTIAINVRFIDY